MFLPPTIPDLDQLEEITLEDAVNLLLKSIAMEEISLSKLMDAERSKVLCALNHCKCGTGTLRDVLEINRSAEDMMKTIIQLQMLLRFKLKNVQELLPCSALPCLLPKRGSTCCMRGTGKGCVQNREDTFYHCPASIYAFLPCGNSQNGTIRYIVGASESAVHGSRSRRVPFPSISPLLTEKGRFPHFEWCSPPPKISALNMTAVG